MKRIAIAGAAGAVVLFVWSSISWMLIPWHLMDKLPGEEGIRQTFKLTQAERGVYWIPGIDHAADTSALTDDEKETRENAWKEAHLEGPIALVVYDPRGSSPLGIMRFIMGFILDFLVATAAAALLAIAAPVLPGMPGRVMFVVLLGVYTVFGTHLMNWNWMNFPLGFSLEMAGDTLLASLLLGVTLGFFVRPGAESSGDGDDIEFDAPETA